MPKLFVLMDEIPPLMGYELITEIIRITRDKNLQIICDDASKLRSNVRVRTLHDLIKYTENETKRLKAMG